MTAGSLNKFNRPKLYAELQLIVFIDIGETSKNTTIKEITLKEALINNRTISECVLFRNGKKYSRNKKDKNSAMKMIAGIIREKELKFILFYSNRNG